MAGALETVIRDMFVALDRGDYQAMLEYFDDKPQVVDELARRWVRGRGELEHLLAAYAQALESCSSKLAGFHEVDWGYTGLVTCWLEQDYTVKGHTLHVSAPTSATLRKLPTGWKIALLHTVPLAEEE